MKIGVIGGSGVYDMAGLKNVAPQKVSTPFGDPSDDYIRGEIGDREVFFLPRHGRGHRLLPSEINHKANIFGFKKLGVSCVLSISAVGSLKEIYRPRDIVLPDQYFDRTKGAGRHTFFGDGLVAHVAFGEPACPELRRVLAEVSKKIIAQKDGLTDVRVSEGGVYVNMEGPAFSTKAESNAYRAMGFDVVGMTSLAEAKLCREAELCYQAMCMVTDYDCWHESEEAVTVEMVIGHLLANAELAREIIAELIPVIPRHRSCRCGSALDNAILSQKDVIPESTLQKLELIVGKYL